jgi:hypothetical protein
VALEGASPGHGSGSVTLRVFLSQGVVCWTFAKLVSVPPADGAELDSGTIGGPHSLLVPLSGARFTSTGCISGSPNEASALGEVVTLPADYFVALNTKTGKTQTPILRGQL